MPRRMQIWYFEKVRGGGEGTYDVGVIPTRWRLRKLLKAAGFTPVVPRVTCGCTTCATASRGRKRCGRGSSGSWPRTSRGGAGRSRTRLARWFWDVAIGSNFFIARRRGDEARASFHAIYDDPRNPWVAGGGAVRVFELYRRLADRGGRDRGHRELPRRARRGGGRRALPAPGRARAVRLEPRELRGRRQPACCGRAEYDAAVFDFSSYTPLFMPRGRPCGITVHHVTGPTARERWGPVLAPALSALERAMIRRARRITATSTATLRAGARHRGPALPIDLVYAGVPGELFELPRRPRGTCSTSAGST
jgi:hypothetical protein